MRSPRGLICVGVSADNGTTAQLVNYIAVEPVAHGDGPRHTRMAFSELEPSTLDPGKTGKRIWVENIAGTLTTDSLSVRIEVEPFSANHAHVYLIATINAQCPHELQLAVHHYDDSAPIDELTLTATMGNYERLRNLWLKDETVSSLHLYADYTGNDFVEKQTYPRDKMITTPNGDHIVFATTNEDNPAAVPVPGRTWWSYKAPRLTQYWRVPAAFVERDLRVRVNGRRVYWKSQTPLPGGTAFENFEVRQHYKRAQIFVFGLSPQQPPDIIGHTK
jgi:hypothetical protein